MKRIIISMFFALTVLLLISSVSSFAGAAATGHFSSPFVYSQSYVGWGPANYYGQSVYIIYRATNTWTWIEKEDSVKESLVQNGTAEIYDITGSTLLDTRTFHVVEDFTDDGKDVAIKLGNWWTVSYTNPYSDDLEFYHYIWKIAGVYRFEVWNKNGERIFRWRSPDTGPGWDQEMIW